MRFVFKSRLSIFSLILFLSLLLAQTGCVDETLPTTPNQANSGSPNLSAQPPVYRTFDDEMEAVAEEASGFGGLYFDENGRLVVRLKDVKQLFAARPAINRFLEKHVYPGETMAFHRMQLMQALVAKPADYDFVELRGFFEEVVTTLLGLSDVISADIDEQTNRIVISTSTSAARIEAEKLIAQLPIPSGAVSFENAGQNPRLDTNLTHTVQPTQSGHRIRTGWGECTLGYNLKHLYPDGVNWDPERYLITASHCTPRWGGGPPSALTDTLGQASLAEKAAVLLYDRIYVAEPYFEGVCPPGRFCRYSDSAVYRYLPDVSSGPNTFPWPTPNSGSLDYFTTKAFIGQSYAMTGTLVYKLGETSGLTSGTVAATCVTVAEANRPPLGGYSNKSLQCAFRARYSSGPGDSGAPVVILWQDGRIAYVGLHFMNDGFFTWYSGWSQMMTDLATEGAATAGGWGVGP